MRACTSRLTFPHPFMLSGYSDELPAGTYDVLMEEERLEGPGFVTYRRSATYLATPPNRCCAGGGGMRRITEADLASALSPCIRRLSGTV